MATASGTSRAPGIIGYVRVSTDEQASSGLGLEAQRKAIRAEAERRVLPLIAIYEDAGLSGKNLKRPALKQAFEAIKRGDAAVLMVAKLDRLTRSVHDATGVMLRAEREGWGLVALDVAVDTTTPQGAAMAQVLVVFAELERKLISQRTKDALAVKKAQGVVLGRRRELGDAIVHRIVSERERGFGWSAIARDLDDDGVPTAQGGQRWYPATVRSVFLANERRTA